MVILWSMSRNGPPPTCWKVSFFHQKSLFLSTTSLVHLPCKSSYRMLRQWKYGVQSLPRFTELVKSIPACWSNYAWFLSFFFSFIFISWRLITLQYCSGFCHTLTWISHGFTCIPHPDPPSHLPLHPIPLGLPSAPGTSTCLMHPTWAGDLFHTW